MFFGAALDLERGWGGLADRAGRQDGHQPGNDPTSDPDKLGAMLSSIQYLNLKDWEPIPWFAPSLEDVHLKIFLSDVRLCQKPIFVHCRSGQNRTGVAVAAYRLLVRGDSIFWTLSEFDGFMGLWRVARMSAAIKTPPVE